MLYYHAASALLPNVYLFCRDSNQSNIKARANEIDLNSVEYYFRKSIEYNDQAKYPVLIIYNKFAVFCGYFINDFNKAIEYFDKCTIECKNSWNLLYEVKRLVDATMYIIVLIIQFNFQMFHDTDGHWYLMHRYLLM